ncbi:MAG TPA: MotA/TolQ/ExbB proton channel family protein [Longimicrobiales bacterium]|nr:MotA/TolQ/ExbB proton channel family protein [Longimicrobiales bacterium]
MSKLWNEMGFIHWPLLVSLVAVTGLAIWAVVRLFVLDRGPDLRTKAWVDAVLFWGGFGMIAGVLGTLIGIIVAAQSIEAAAQVNAALVWGGMKVALLSSAVGMLILVWAGLLWFGLQLRWRMMEARALQERPA